MNSSKIKLGIKICGCFIASAVFFLLLCSCGTSNNTPAQTAYETESVTMNAAKTAEPSPTPAATVSPAPTPIAFVGYAFCIAERSANITDKAGHDGAIIGSVPNGAIADIIKRQEGWLYIAYNSTDGYVKSDCFKELHAPDIPVPSGEWDMILVNPSHPLPDGFEVTVADFEGGQVDARILDICRQMFSDASGDGITLQLVDAYRSNGRQNELYQKKVDSYVAEGYSREDAETKAATITARPGTSEHQTGLALDIVTPSHTKMNSGFAKTDAYKWLDENAYNYGFVLRYPDGKKPVTKIIYEPWHWRFVGADAAVKIKASGKCLEEYLGIVD